MLKELCSLRLLHHASQIHDSNLSGDMFHHCQVVADKHIGQIKFFAQVQ